MTGEEMERAIAFLIEQQADLTAKVAKNTEGLTRLETVVERMAGELAATSQRMERAIEDTNRRIEDNSRGMRLAVEAIRDSVLLLGAVQAADRARLNSVERRIDAGGSAADSEN